MCVRREGGWGDVVLGNGGVGVDDVDGVVDGGLSRELVLKKWL